ncbi:MAG: RNA methyltransferase [Clostridiales bacterium]|nr:RNA methyltransferase [Clostridiales bacterium]
MVITSASNDRIKRLRSLYKDRKNRYLCGEYVAEGVTMIKDLDESDLNEVYIKESRFDELSRLFPSEKTIAVKDAVFDTVAGTKTPSGVIATIKISESTEISGDKAIMLCGLSDAGNVGTIIRTACARGIKTVICVDTADPFSPKSVRASMGGIVKTNIVIADYEKAFSLINGYTLVALDMDGICIYDYKQVGKTVIAVGNEAHGIPDCVKVRCDVKVNIPMAKDGVESLNAAVSAGIAMYLL